MTEVLSQNLAVVSADPELKDQLPGKQKRVRWPWPVVCAFGAIALGIIARLDMYVGPDISLGFLYIVPVLVVTWFTGSRPGYLISLLAAFSWLYAERNGAAIYKRPLMAFLNASTRLEFFLIAATVLGAFKNLSTRLGVLVEQRTLALRKLAWQLSEAEDAERRRLAYDIHDGFSQNLSMLKMMLAASLPETAPDSSSRQKIHDALAMVNDLIDRSRTLTFDLHPAMLDHLGLVPTLRRYSEQFSRQTNIDVTVTEVGIGRQLSGEMAHYLFRSTKELFSNAARHGRAKQIVVAVHWDEKHTRIVVDDDGSGFDTAAAFKPGVGKGLGLLGMRERLLSFGGNIRVESKPGEGTRAVLELPFGEQELVP